MKQPVSQNHLFYWTMYFISFVYSASILLSLRYFHYYNFWLYWTLGAVLLFVMYRSFALIIEFTMLLVIWYFYNDSLLSNFYFLYFALIAIVLISASHKIRLRGISILTGLLIAIWFSIMLKRPVSDIHFIHYFIFIATGAMLAMHIYDDFRASLNPIKTIDVLLESHSSNTAHYTYQLIDELKQHGAEATVHRFHYYRRFQATLSGDALVLAFPVSGWKPPWPLLWYMIRKLPAGTGKPVYILYTCAGGPENAGFISWLILTFKGYRVAGRHWTAYPMNVATFRIGPKRLFRFLDRLGPLNSELKLLKKSADDFLKGNPVGMPTYVWAFPLLIFGLLLDNKWINTVLYRNHVWHKRCNQCNVCVVYCPAGRLTMVHNFPKASGTCALCLSCINLCPTNAMEMLFFSEYGQPYPPRWPELLPKPARENND